jgi:hypothetical protein
MWPAEPEPEPLPAALPEPPAASAPVPALATAPAVSRKPEPVLHDMTFVRQARRKAFWRRRGVRVSLVLMVLVLSALLAVQFVAQERDRLAAARPGLQPLIEILCQPLHCRVAPPRQIEAVAIDSSSFNKLRNEAYRLNLTLKNQATTQVAMPAIELTLTDTQDQPVIRRVLMPADLGANVGVIAAGSEWSGSVAMSVAPSAPGNRIAGYRLLAFYP